MPPKTDELGYDQEQNFKHGESLRATRLRLGLSQLNFARLIPVDRAYLSELENGRQKVQEWVLDKAEKIERQSIGNDDTPGRQAFGASDIPLLLEAVAAGLDATTLMAAVGRITSDPRISVGARSLASELLGSKARFAPPSKHLPGKIAGLSSSATYAQRAASAKQQALARRAAQAPSPSPQAAAPTAGKGPRVRGTPARQKSRRSPRGPAQA